MTKEDNAIKAENAKNAVERPEKEKRCRYQKKDKVKAPTKIIIRHLPPTMTEEEFLRQIEPLPEHDFYYFADADWSLGFDATCRAYITLKSYDDVFLFRDRFDGYVFVDSKGAEYPAIVEFAPFQGILKNKSRRSDNKVNTIEEESHYQQFLVKLEEDREAAAKGGECKLEFTLDRKKEEKITSTPLLQYLANKKEKRREEARKRTEEKKRQREEEKEKRRQSQGTQVTKIITNQESAGRRDGKSAGGKENAGDKTGNAPDERKNSRSKRKAERDQRRREEHEQRKRLEREQQEKGGIGDAGVEAKTTALKEGKSQDELEKAADGKQQRKDGKKYNDRRDRERERERNRNRKEKEKDKDREKGRERNKVREKDKQKELAKKCDQPDVASVTSVEAEVAKAGVEVNESVMSFIRSVATAKEFVPSSKRLENRVIESQVIDAADKNETAEKAEKRAETAEQRAHEKTERQLQRQRSAEERRIRNKDRPSIAIYQPKARLRLSEEREGTSSGKDPRSNPTSDCESLKKEEQRSKKVSRYSERRSERRANRERQEAAEAAQDMEQEGAFSSKDPISDSESVKKDEQRAKKFPRSERRATREQRKSTEMEVIVSEQDCKIEQGRELRKSKSCDNSKSESLTEPTPAKEVSSEI